MFISASEIHMFRPDFVPITSQNDECHKCKGNVLRELTLGFTSWSRESNDMNQGIASVRGLAFATPAFREMTFHTRRFWMC
jgi:hypothetical protein